MTKAPILGKSRILWNGSCFFGRRSIPLNSPTNNPSIAHLIGEICFKSLTTMGGGEFLSTPLGLMTPTTMNRTIIGNPVAMALSPSFEQLPIAKPSDAPAAVINAKVAVSLLHEMCNPVTVLRTVVKTAAKKVSTGISAMTLDSRYSKLEYCCRICSRSTTARSFEKRCTVFINAIMLMLITPNDSSAVRSAMLRASGTSFRTDLKICENRTEDPIEATSRATLYSVLRMFCLHDRSRSAAKRRTGVCNVLTCLSLTVAVAL
mmetsp:Transcript_20964/g.34648  ORF Transcript_20964/g.34648 Transcript_20964/m.34648 type:complete len:262 (+) Transcript_20964:468-1253(+)